MRVVRERPTWAHLTTVLAGLAAGPLLGLCLGSLVTPDSELVRTVGAFGYALVFVVGIVAWAGVGIVAVVLSRLARLLRGGRPPHAPPGGGDRVVPPGYRSFPWAGALLGAGIGLVAGVATELTVGSGFLIWGVAGLAYGAALWAAAHHGYLPFPEGD